MVELSLEFKVGFGFEDDFLQGFLERLDSSLSVLAQLGDPLVLPLTAKALLLCLVHLTVQKTELRAGMLGGNKITPHLLPTSHLIV